MEKKQSRPPSRQIPHNCAILARIENDHEQSRQSVLGAGQKCEGKDEAPEAEGWSQPRQHMAAAANDQVRLCPGAGLPCRCGPVHVQVHQKVWR